MSRCLQIIFITLVFAMYAMNMGLGRAISMLSVTLLISTLAVIIATNLDFVIGLILYPFYTLGNKVQKAVWKSKR